MGGVSRPDTMAKVEAAIVSVMKLQDTSPKLFATIVLVLFGLGFLSLAACDADTPAPTNTPIARPQIAAPTSRPSLPTLASSAATPISTIGHVAQVVARVNGTEVSAADFNAALDEARLDAEQRAGKAIDWQSADGQKALAQLRQLTLDDLIDNVLVVQAAAAEGVTVSQPEIDAAVAENKKPFTSVTGAFDQVRYANWLAGHGLTEETLRRTVTETLIFEKMSAKKAADVPTQEEQVHVRLLVVGAKDQAEALRDQITKGADFGTLAAQNSLDTVSKTNKGDAGWLRRGVQGQPPDLEKAAFDLTQPNQISPIIALPYGYAILQLIERGQHPLPPEVVEERRTSAFSSYIEGLRNKATIEKLLKL